VDTVEALAVMLLAGVDHLAGMLNVRVAAGMCLAAACGWMIGAHLPD
jgi:hypothetical protein